VGYSQHFNFLPFYPQYDFNILLYKFYRSSFIQISVIIPKILYDMSTSILTKAILLGIPDSQ